MKNNQNEINQPTEFTPLLPKDIDYKSKITLINGYHIKFLGCFIIINILMIFILWFLSFYVFNLNQCRHDIWICICLAMTIFNFFMFSTLSIKNVKNVKSNHQNKKLIL